MSDLIEAVPEAFLERGQRDVIAPLLNKEYKPDGYEPALVAMASINNLVYLIRASAAESANAMSWRDYKVGAAAIAYNFEIPAMGVMTGYNVKPQQGQGLNLHAEQIAIAKARRNKLDQIFALAVWGDPTDLDANPSQSPTLRPCRRCSGMFTQAPEISDKTLVLSGNQDLTKCELYTVEELADYYQDPNATGPVSDTPVYSLADDMNEDDYDRDIFVPHLLPKIAQLYPDSHLAQVFPS